MAVLNDPALFQKRPIFGRFPTSLGAKIVRKFGGLLHGQHRSEPVSAPPASRWTGISPVHTQGVILMNPELNTELEMLVDQHGLATVMNALAEVCHHKAHHLGGNWQDHNAAENWTTVANLITALANKVSL
jgi:hypothetical protein